MLRTINISKMAECKMNLAAIQQRDPYIVEILDTASQVALYSFNSNANEWILDIGKSAWHLGTYIAQITFSGKTSIEGSLFIYRRSASPLNGFMILNRLGLNNLVEPITKDLEFQQQEPFLLYRNSKSIYGVWFYDKEECKRLGGKLNGYVQEILRVQNKKQTSPTVVGGNKMAGGASVTESGQIVPNHASQVDIIQMLSQAQLEYDTGSKNSEPRPMIDNPNTTATKSINLIRPMPVKRLDSDSNAAPDETSGNPTPGTFTLDALFRTVSLQQGIGSQKSTNISTPVSVASSYPLGPVDVKKRSISMSASPNSQVTESHVKSSENDLPPLLRQIMSTRTLEDVEQQPVQRKSVHLGTKDNGQLAALPGIRPGIPDFSQPPPNHPAYRGPSPQTPAKNKPLDKVTRPKSMSSIKSVENVRGEPNAPVSVGSVLGSVPTSQILSGNLASLLNSATSLNQSLQSTTSLSSGSLKMSTETVGGGIMSSQSDSNLNSREKVDRPVVMNSGPLLTPGDLIQSSMLNSSTAGLHSSTSGLHSSASGVFPIKDKLVITSQCATTSSLITELLSPMAFTTSTTRKTPPVVASVSSVTEKSFSHDEKLDRSGDSVAALTKEQMQQTLLYLLKNDSNFINTVHEAYLKSLHELSGQKS